MTLDEWVSKVEGRVKEKSVEGNSRVQLCKRVFVPMGDERMLEQKFRGRGLVSSEHS